jgi:hypothetical protein
MWVVRYAWFQIGVGGQICLVEIGVSPPICVVVNRCGWSDMRGSKYGWVVRYAWLEVGVDGQICVFRNSCGWSDLRG